MKNCKNSLIKKKKIKKKNLGQIIDVKWRQLDALLQIFINDNNDYD